MQALLALNLMSVGFNPCELGNELLNRVSLVPSSGGIQNLNFLIGRMSNVMSSSFSMPYTRK